MFCVDIAFNYINDACRLCSSFVFHPEHFQYSSTLLLTTARHCAVGPESDYLSCRAELLVATTPSTTHNPVRAFPVQPPRGPVGQLLWAVVPAVAQSGRKATELVSTRFPVLATLGDTLWFMSQKWDNLRLREAK